MRRRWGPLAVALGVVLSTVVLYIGCRSGSLDPEPASPAPIPDRPAIEGRLLTADGEPACGGWVRLERRAVSVDPDGAFRFEDVDVGSRSLRAGAAGGAFVSTVVEVPPAGLTDLELRLPARRRVAGRVLSAVADAPIGGATVLDGRFGRPIAVTDADGRFAVDLPPGDSSLEAGRATGDLRVEAPGHAPAAVFLGQRDGLETIHLEPASSLEVRVLGASGAAIRIQAFGGVPPTARSSTREASDADAVEIRWGDLPAGAFQILVEARRPDGDTGSLDLRTRDLTVVLAIGDETSVVVDFD